MGFPAGLPKTLTVDLTGRLRPAARTRVRIVTGMRIYWDRIRVETGPEDPAPRLRDVPLGAARARWVGYPEQWSPDGRAPFLYDYARRRALGPWKLPAGRLTPLGDVRDLLAEVDDRYVILASGEGIEVDFDGLGLPALDSGWTRDWLLEADGFGKDMDPHSVDPDGVEPLPRHGQLPYAAADWKLPSEQSWRRFRDRRVTRPAW